MPKKNPKAIASKPTEPIQPDSHAAFADRLLQIEKELGSARQLAALSGVSNNAVHLWRRASEPARDNLVKVARAANVSISWLAAGEGEMRPSRPPQGYQLPLWPSHVGPGAQQWGEPPPLAFSERLWNRILELSHGSTPGLIEVEDDAMTPTLQPNDLALVQFCMVPTSSGIWFLAGVGFRRLQLLPGEPGEPAGAIVSCDNPKYGSKTQRLSARDLVKLQHPGRVIWRAGII
jgi:phage repressor protein C with HTH and peptisase S24 domain